MIYPIVAYGDPVLREVAKDIANNGTIDIKKLSDDMFETMYHAQGVGLAAPQIGLDIRLFVVDAEPLDEVNQKGFKRVFVNPKILEETGTPWGYEEGCLSIPDIRAQVMRKPVITMRYFDADWQEHTETFDGLAARVIQHEYDHLEGVLFTDLLSSIRKRMIKGKLVEISKGLVRQDYRMKFPAMKKTRSQ